MVRIMETLSKKQIRKLTQKKNLEIDVLLNGKRFPEDMIKVQKLLGETIELRHLLWPNHPERESLSHYTVTSDEAVKHEIEKKYEASQGSTKSENTCSRCGGIDHHHFMNGTPWCFTCDLPLSKPKRRPNKDKFSPISIKPLTEKTSTL